MHQKIYHLLVAMVMAMLCSLSTQAQVAAPPPPSQPAAIGTFQLIRTNKVEEALQADALYLIESLRNDSAVVYHAFSQNLMVRILSKREIEQPGFQPLQHIYMDEDRRKENER